MSTHLNPSSTFLTRSAEPSFQAGIVTLPLVVGAWWDGEDTLLARGW